MIRSWALHVAGEVGAGGRDVVVRLGGRHGGRDAVEVRAPLPVLLAVWRMFTTSSTPSVSVATVTVTVCAVFQLPEGPPVKVSDDGENVGSSDDESAPRVRATVTVAEGWEPSLTV